jgi:hypothetical protein
VLDDIFGADCFVVTIPVKKKGSQKSSLMDPVNDYLVWYSRNPRSSGQVKFHPLFERRELDAPTLAEFKMVELTDEREFPISAVPDPDGVPRDYRLNPRQLFIDHSGARLFRSNPLTSGGERKNQSLPYKYRGKVYSPGPGQCWKTTARTDDGSVPGMDRLAAAGRLISGLGLDVFDPVTMQNDHRKGDDVPAWFLDTDYDDLVFHVGQAFFPRTSAWDALKRALRAAFEDSVWEHLAGTVSEPFAAGEHKKVAVKVIDDRGNELMVVRSLDEAEVER